jgi:6-phosphogluconate dehydrogenase
MNVGIIGLGKMGGGIAQRIAQAGHAVFGYDPYLQSTLDFPITVVSDIKTVMHHTHIIIIMIPAGELIDQTLQAICAYATAHTVIIDGGNSNFHDSIRRAAWCKQKGFTFLDCGTSGGLHGKTQGYCLMIGGNKDTYEALIPLWQALAAPNGYVYTGPSGSGHYVKMVHNGIEYGILQAYAEGFHLLRKGHFKDINLSAVAHAWEHGSVIRSWLLELLAAGLSKNAELTTIPGKVGENGTGRWMQEDAEKHHIPTPVLQAALNVRAQSQKSGGNYGTKVISLARLLFGGHMR